MVICVVVQTLSFITVRTDVQKHKPQIHKLMIICVVVEALSIIRVIFIIYICGVGTMTCTNTHHELQQVRRHASTTALMLSGVM